MGNTFGEIIGLPSLPESGIIGPSGEDIAKEIWEREFPWLNVIQGWFQQITRPIDEFFQGIVGVFDVIWALIVSIFGFIYIGVFLFFGYSAIFYILLL